MNTFFIGSTPTVNALNTIVIPASIDHQNLLFSQDAFNSYSVTEISVSSLSGEIIKKINFVSNFLRGRKEDLCIVAIRNLIKKNEFLQLSLQLESRNITESEFETEIESNSEKYIIDVDYLTEEQDLTVISSIVQKLKIEMSIDDVAEMFSLELDSVNEGISKLMLH